MTIFILAGVANLCCNELSDDEWHLLPDLGPAGGGGKGGTGQGGAGSGGTAGAGSGGASQACAGACGSKLQRLTVHDADGPRRGVDVLVHDAEGTLRSRAKTGVDGKASVAVAGGDSVTVAYVGLFNVRFVRSHYGLDGGFDLDVDLGESNTFVWPPDPMRIHLTPSAPGLQPAHYIAAFSCDDIFSSFDPGAAIKRVNYFGCDGKPYDVLVVAVDANWSPLAYGSLTDLPFRAGGGAVLEVAADKTDFVEYAFAVQNTPAGFEPGLLSAVAERGTWPFLGLSHGADAPSASAATYWAPGGFFSKIEFGHGVSEGEDVIGLRRRVDHFQRVDGATPGGATWSAGAMALFESIEPDYVTDPPRPSVAWQLGPSGAVGDAVALTAGWIGPDVELEWEVYAPPARAGTLRFVEMPDDLFDYRPGAQSEFDFLDVLSLDVVGAETLAEFYVQWPGAAEVLVSAGEHHSPSVSRSRPQRARSRVRGAILQRPRSQP